MFQKIELISTSDRLRGRFVNFRITDDAWELPKEVSILEIDPSFTRCEAIFKVYDKKDWADTIALCLYFNNIRNGRWISENSGIKNLDVFLDILDDKYPQFAIKEQFSETIKDRMEKFLLLS